MKYGIDVHHFGDFADVRAIVGMAREADRAGWDGFFIWDHLTMPWPGPVIDPWVALSGIALGTERIQFGPMVTPLPRRRPQKVARETATLDVVSNGRLIFGVGLGAPFPGDFEAFGETGDLKVRAAMLDEGLDVLSGLWSGQPFSYSGKYYQVHDTVFQPTPVQRPRIPVWVAGTWPNKGPFRRAARWDGVFPMAPGDEDLTPEQIREIAAFVGEQRQSDAPFDIVQMGFTYGDDPQRDAEKIAPYAEAGATWWIEYTHPRRWRGDAPPIEQMSERIRKGPPRIEE